MGEMADDYVDRMIGGWFNPRHARAKPPSFQSGAGRRKWRRADGTVVRMETMTIAHLEAARRVCEAKGNTGKAADLEAVLAEKIADMFSAGTRKNPVDNS